MNSTPRFISTGSIQLDEILGGNGIPAGCIAEVFGEQGTGKTTLALELIQTVQARNGQAAYIDAEHSLDIEYARKIGVRPDHLLFAQPDTGEEGLDITRELVESGSMDLIVVDSAAALVPGREIEQKIGEETHAEQARMLSGALRKLSPDVKQSGTVLCFTNQVRTRLNRTAGPDETTPGGNALKFYTSVRIKLEEVTSIEPNDHVIGRRVRCHVVKNRSAPPDQSVEIDFLFDRGICPYSDVLDAGLEHGAVKHRSGVYHVQQTPLGRDRQGARETLERNPDLYEVLLKEVRESNKPDDRSEEC